MSDRPTLVDLPVKKDVLSAAREQVMREFDAMVENQKVLARLRRASFLAHIEAGFTDAQALELCCK